MSPRLTSEYATIPELFEKHIDSLVVSSGTTSAALDLKGSPSVLYVFATTCQYCEAQKAHIAELLASIPAGVRVHTASGEAVALTESYWKPYGSVLAPPLGLHPLSVASLDVKTVPRMYFLDNQGQIKSALTGTVLTWTADSLAHALKEATVVAAGS